MSEIIKEFKKGDLLYIDNDGKAEWGYPEGYPYKEIETILDDTFEFADGGSGFYIHQITDEGFTIVDGNSYTVIWDGVTYQCVATAFIPSPGYNLLVLGNLHIVFPEDAADTGEPFLFVMMSERGKGFYANDTAATHTITVRRKVVYPMDNEYLSLQNSNIINDLAAGSLKTRYAKEATGRYSFAEGYNTVASGSHAHAEGYNTVASGYAAHAEGNRTIASGQYTHAEGNNTAASGEYSHAEGCGNVQYIRISGEACATVYTVTSSIDLPIIEGSLITYNDQIVRKILSYNSSEKKLTLDGTLNNNEALNSIQVIIVESGIAGGSYSHSEGQGSVAFGNFQHVQGKYNIVDFSNKYSHIVGNGSSHSARSNVHTLDWNGNAWFAGDVYVKGANQDDTAAIKLATLNDLPQGVPACTTADNGKVLKVIDGIPIWTEFLPTLTSPNGTKYQLTVSDDGTLSTVVVS